MSVVYRTIPRARTETAGEHGLDIDGMRSRLAEKGLVSLDRLED